EVIVKAKQIAAHLLNSNAGDMTLVEGVFTDVKTGQSVSMEDVIAASLEQSRLPGGMKAGALDTDTIYEREIISCPNGCHSAEVEVDPETGVIHVERMWVVDDFGTIINPLLADGQVMGGIAQGL
ncbi:MAG: molybdopterin cofactor-binding domain-containing protein, partial [Alphaproteobacteria bacterium]